jgi:P4 family phage/plasmid primase-like protien
MQLSDFDLLVGQNSYVRTVEKQRRDSAIVNKEVAEAHLFNGGQIGWWVRPGYIIVDVDEGKPEIMQVIKRLKLRTLMMRTPNGLHMYFKTTKEFPQKIKMVLPCGLSCDFRCANKGYVLLPWNSEGRKFNKRREIAELPLEFTPLLNRKESLYGLKEGDGRNSTLFSHLMAYKNKGANASQIEEMAEVINDIVFAEPMERSELRKLVNSVHKYEAQEQGENPYLLYTEKGRAYGINSRAVCDYFVNRGDIFVLGEECYQYHAGVYKESSSWVRNTIRDMVMLDSVISQERIMSTYRLILDDIRLHRRPSQLNRNHGLLNFTNGVWDIKTKELKPHDSQYLQTLQIPHEVGLYKPIEETKLWHFLRLTKMPKADVEMILLYMAYCLTLDYGLKTFMILYGPSNTGKSVLLRFIENMVGRENTSALSMHELSARFYPSQLYNKLLNSCGDNGSLPLSSIENLKKITGGDQIMHEKKGKEPFFFVPFAKLIFSFNQLPLQLEEKSNAFYKRMRILYMKNELFLNDAYVNDLCSNESIAEVIPYLLSLLPIEAIPNTPRSTRYVEALRQDSDSIQGFIADRCIIRKDATVTKQEFYEEYTAYCIENGREGHRKHAFMRGMRALGYTESRNKNREACWRGITTHNVELYGRKN